MWITKQGRTLGAGAQVPIAGFGFGWEPPAGMRGLLLPPGPPQKKAYARAGPRARANTRRKIVLETNCHGS